MRSGLGIKGKWRMASAPFPRETGTRENDKRIPAPRTFQSTSHLLAATAGKCGDALAIRAAGHKTHISNSFFPLIYVYCDFIITRFSRDFMTSRTWHHKHTNNTSWETFHCCKVTDPKFFTKGK